MKCLTLALLDDHAEGTLDGPEREALSRHFDQCVRCREMLAERRRYLEACRSLPAARLPAGFARRVAQAAFPGEKKRRLGLMPFAAGLASLALTAVVLWLAGLYDLSGLLSSTNKMLGHGLQGGISFLARAFRLIAGFLKAAAEMLRIAWEGLNILARAIPPQAVVLILSALLALGLASVLGLRRLTARR